MISTREVYAMQKDVDILKDRSKNESCISHGPSQFDISSLMWAIDTDTNLYKYILNHNENIPIEKLTARFYCDNDNILINYKYIDNNSIAIFSDVICNISIMLGEIDVTCEKFKPDVDFNNYYKKDEMYSRAQMRSRAEVYSIDETYSKDEVYTKSEVYAKGETYSSSELYRKDELFNKAQAEKELGKVSDKVLVTQDTIDMYKKWDTVYGSEDLDKEATHAKNFYDSKYKDMFRYGPRWIFSHEANGLLAAKVVGSHQLFPKMDHIGRCFGMYVSEEKDIRERKWYFAEVDKNYKIINKYGFSTDIYEFVNKYCENTGLTSYKASPYSDMSYQIYKNKAYIANAVSSFFYTPGNKWFGFIRVLVIDLDTFKLSNSWIKEFNSTEIYAINRNNFVEIDVNDNRINIITNKFDNKVIEDTYTYRPKTNILSFSHNGELFSSDDTGVKVYKSHSTIFHEGYLYFVYSRFNTENTNDETTTLVVNTYERLDNGELSLIKEEDLYGNDRTECQSSYLISQHCFDYYMYNDDGSIREDGIGARILYYGGYNEDIYDMYVVNVVYNYHSSISSVSITKIENNDIITENSYSVGHYGMYYTGNKGEYVSVMSKHEGGKYSPHYSVNRQTIRNGVYEKETHYYDGVISLNDATWEQSFPGHYILLCMIGGVSWLNSNGVSDNNSGIMIKEGYKPNEYQRFYWSEDGDTFYLNKDGIFEEILHEEKTDTSVFMTKQDFSTKSLEEHSHDDVYERDYVIDRFYTDKTIQMAAIKKKIDAAILRVEALEKKALNKNVEHHIP